MHYIKHGTMPACDSGSMPEDAYGMIREVGCSDDGAQCNPRIACRVSAHAKRNTVVPDAIFFASSMMFDPHEVPHHLEILHDRSAAALSM